MSPIYAAMISLPEWTVSPQTVSPNKPSLLAPSGILVTTIRQVANTWGEVNILWGNLSHRNTDLAQLASLST